MLERVRELLAEDEDGSGGHEEEQGAARGERPLSWEELEDVMVRACLVPVGGVPSPEEVSGWVAMVDRWVDGSLSARWRNVKHEHGGIEHMRRYFVWKQRCQCNVTLSMIIICMWQDIRAV